MQLNTVSKKSTASPQAANVTAKTIAKVEDKIAVKTVTSTKRKPLPSENAKPSHMPTPTFASEALLKHPFSYDPTTFQRDPYREMYEAEFAEEGDSQRNDIRRLEKELEEVRTNVLDVKKNMDRRISGLIRLQFGAMSLLGMFNYFS